MRNDQNLINGMRSHLYLLVKRLRLINLLKRFTKVGKFTPEIIIFNQNNLYYALPSGHSELVESLIYFEFESKDLSLIQEFARHRGCETFLDIGANIGEFSIGMSHVAQRIIAVEGNPQLSKCLKVSNILNGGQITVLNQWVVPHNQYGFSPNFTGNLLTTSLVPTLDQSSQDQITCVTLSDLLGEFEPSMLKIDIEGLDIDVVLNTEKIYFRTVDYLVLEVFSDSSQIEALMSHLNLAGFEFVHAVNLVKGEITIDEFLLSAVHRRSIFNLHFSKP